jgi:molecular chaperone DnaJ
MYDFDPKKDYYNTLWISEDASQDEIKKAFKKLAVKHHPDKPGGDKEKFQEANEAHAVLSDEKKRQQYDMMRKGWFGGWGFGGWGFDFGGFQSGQGGGFDFGGVDLWDLVGGIFGGGGFSGWGSRKPRQGADIKHQIDISFEDAFLWTEKTIAYTRQSVVKGASEETCPECNGQGTSVQQVQTPFGVMQTRNTCPRCQWSGKIYKKDWKELDNGWLETRKETLTVNIPAGIKDDVYIKYAGKGHDGPWGVPAGDLFIKIRILASANYERKGSDLYVKADVTLFDLVLGGTVEVPHPEGKLQIKIPKGTQIGDLVKISGKWFGGSGIFGGKWHLYVDPQVHIPKRLSKKQEKLWKELQES